MHQLPVPQVAHSRQCQPPSHQSTSVLFDNQSSPIKISARHSPKLNLSPGGGLVVNSTSTLRCLPTPNLSPGGLAVNSTQTLRRLPHVNAKSKYAKMMSRQHEAIIQIKQEKRKPSYPSSIVPKVRSAECDCPPAAAVVGRHGGSGCCH